MSTVKVLRTERGNYNCYVSGKFDTCLSDEQMAIAWIIGMQSRIDCVISHISYVTEYDVEKWKNNL